MCADLYFYIRTWLCVSCGYKKKNTWQRARAARQVQSFHSKHICVCWASVALGRQRALACRASDYWALGESALTAAGLQSTARSHGGGNRGGYETCRHPSQPFSTLTVCVKSKCSSSLEIGFWKHPGDSAIAKLILGGFLVCWIFFYCLLVFWGLSLGGFLLRMAQLIFWPSPLQKPLCCFAELSFLSISVEVTHVNIF